MKRTAKDLDNILDRATAAIRDEKLDQSVVDSAADRVLARLALAGNNRAAEEVSVTQIRSCADFQALMPAYLRGSLPEARALLISDHTRECLPCRKALKEARSGQTNNVSESTEARGLFSHAYMKWAAAAVLVIGVGLVGIVLFNRINNINKGSDTIVQDASGPIYVVEEVKSRSLSVGGLVDGGERIRTAKDANAMLRLTDGSLVEMKERSEVSVNENSQGITIRLERGNVIVQAAKQRNRHLYVQTDDCLVTVTGTIFSVNSGTKGSRVSVIEGEVHVDHAGEDNKLRPGDQISTNPNMERVSIAEEIAWSRDAARYIQMLADLTALNKDINNKVSTPTVRYSTQLLDIVPEETVFYAAIPNLSAKLSEAYGMLKERITSNPALNEWWRKSGSTRHDEHLSTVIEKVHEFGQYLGGEVVVAATMKEKGEPDSPVVMAELNDPNGFRAFVEKNAATFSGNQHPVRFIDDPFTATATPGKEEILVWVHGNFFAAAVRIEPIRQVAASLQSPGSNRFVNSEFHKRIAEIYQEGAGIILAANLEKIIVRTMKTDKDAERLAVFQQLGVLDLKHLVAEHKTESSNRSHTRAMITFSQSTRGIASWLAAPGPMGALEYISPEANIATAFVVKNPVALVDDLMATVATSPHLAEQLRSLEAKHGFSIRNDFAAPLGGEIAFALDGPVLPFPSWKMVLEVYDTASLQRTFERIVEEFNKQGGDTQLKMEQTEAGGRTYYAIKTQHAGLEFHYTYVNGYLVAAPSRALVDRAVRYRETGYTLLRSQRFLSALPEDRNTNFSALVYHDLAPLIAPIAQMAGNQKNLGSDEQKALKQLQTMSPPTLACAYAYGDRIIFTANSEGGPFGLGAGSLMGLPAAFDIQKLLGKIGGGK